MKPPFQKFEPFHFQTLGALCDEACRLELDLPISRSTSLLGEPVRVGGRILPNRVCAQPMEGCDADANGAPGEWTFCRYRRLAEGGFGLIWLEATAVEACGRSSPHQLFINQRNVAAFAGLVQEIRQSARQRWGHEILLVLQLAHAGRYCRPEGVAAPLIAWHDPALDQQQGFRADSSVVSDDELDHLQCAFIAAGRLALEAGFDGVDIKACHGDLLAELLSVTPRTGRYGGTFENRSRFLREVASKLRALHPGLLLACKFSVAADKAGCADSVEVARMLESAGVQLLNVAAAEPEANTADEHRTPLHCFVRQAEVTQTIQQAVPQLPVVAGGFSWFRHFLPNVAAGVIERGGATLVGIGRAALAYPSLAGDMLAGGQLDADACCITCGACLQLVKDGGRSGCVVTDRGRYAEEYLRCRHFSLDNLRDEAKRCRGCEPAPCRTGCPTRIHVPAFLKAFADGDDDAAYEIIRQANVLPGMCACLCPVGTLCEGHCVAGTLDGAPIPIHDIQHAVYWSARLKGRTGLLVPELDTRKKIAVVGGGPAGIACAVTLLERGHRVVLFERDSRLGGTPELAIRDSRFTGARDEVEAVLKPALRGARLLIRFGVELGRDITLAQLRQDHDAVFLAAGVWGEQSLGCAEGVVSGVTFLRQVKNRAIRSVPSRVFLLAGGDSAMDCARVALERGARELLVVYAGALSDMHWHMADSWFRTPGVHFMTMTRPVGYRIGPDGKVTGLKMQRTLAVTPDSVLLPEEILDASLIIEAMGLGLEASLSSALQACSFSAEGLVKTAGDVSLACGVPGLFAGGGMVNGGASVSQCVAEGMRAGLEIDMYLRGCQGA